MTNQDVLKNLNEIDKYMIENVGPNGKIQNSDDIYARIHISNIQEIKKYIDDTNINGVLRNRVEQTENALLYSMSKENLQPSNNYFKWIENTKHGQYIAKPDAIQLYYDICTGHEPIITINYARQYLPNDIDNKEEILYNVEMIQQEYDKLRELDTKKVETTELVVKRSSPFQQLKNFFSRIFNSGNNKRQSYSTTNNDNINRHQKYCETLSNGKYSDNQNESKDSQIQKPEHLIAISDLHGDMERWEKVKAYMRSNTNSKFIILGDAMDRGDYGPEILLQIKELSDVGRVQYIPGNHDIFAYNYLKMRDNVNSPIYMKAKALLERNYGEVTMQKLNNFKELVSTEIRNGNIKNNITIDELTQWLGKQPIQKTIKENGIDFAIAHAIFDEKLYNYDSSFNLEKALQLETNGGKASELYNRFLNCMWYRENDPNTHYAPLAFPNGYVGISGHTMQKEIGLGHIQGDPAKGIFIIDTGKGKFAGENLTEFEVQYFDEDDGR